MRGEWDIPRNAAIGFSDVDEHAPAVDIVNLEIPQFVAAKPSGVKRRDDRPMLQVAGVIENPGDLCRAQDARKARERA